MSELKRKKKYQSLLVKTPLPVVKSDRSANPVNGFDSEILAAGRLLSACGAEVRWSSRNEEGNKIDIILSYEHPWYKAERLFIMVQVKSGPSYGHSIGSGFTLKASAKKLSQRTSKGICVIWVDRSTSKTFWAFVHPKTQKGQQEYGMHHQITPALRFDLARCDFHGFDTHMGGLGITLTTKGGTLAEKRRYAKLAYQKLRLSKYLSPVLGEITISRIGWRHMFRSSRSAVRKETSFVVIPHLDKILMQRPSENVVLSTTYIPQGDYTIRRIEYILAFSQCEYFNKKIGQLKNIKVIIRVAEEIRYPIDWDTRGIIGQRIDRSVTLISCYYKLI
jgi:hypothetical protein